MSGTGGVPRATLPAMLRWNDDLRTLDLSVGDLLAAGERHLRTLAMSGRARLAAGSALHRDVQAEGGRGDDDASWRNEVRLRHRRVVREWTVTIHARLDGVSETEEGVIIEEIKSSGLPGDALEAVEGFPAWEKQLALYLWMARCERWDAPRGLLRVVSLLDGGQRFVPVTEPETLEGEVLAYLDAQVARRETRLAWQALRAGAPVPFAHDDPRPGQTEAADATYAAGLLGRHLLLTAPTGTGKTAALLHGALRASAERGLQVYWATARTTQGAIVERTLTDMSARGALARSVTLRAREASCLQTVVDCRPEACPAARDHFARAPAALAALPDLATHAEVMRVARAHNVCPHALARERAELSDVVLGDLNHVFDPDSRAFGEDESWMVVVDEAHQLPERVQEMASPALTRPVIEAARLQAGGAAETDAAWISLRDLADEIGEAFQDAALLGEEVVEGELLVEVNRRRWTDLRDRCDELALDHAGLLHAAWGRAYGRSGTEGATSPLPSQEIEEDPWTALVHALSRFVSALSRAGEETVAVWTPERLQLVNRDTAGLLGPVFGKIAASVCTSATLAPTWFFRERCGLDPDRTDEHEVPPHFPAENRLVVAVPGVSTAFRHRERDSAVLAEAIERCVEATPGNVAVFFSSFAVLDDLLGRVGWADRAVLRQTPSMDGAARDALLARMRTSDEDTVPCVLAAVLGGIFAEGVDLPRGALRTVIVVGPALPPPSAVLALRQAWWQERFDDGFALASVQPGMTRVVQAAGRVVRGPDERGAVVLLCQRFVQHAYASLLPPSWEVEKARKPWEALRGFFGEEGTPPRMAREAASSGDREGVPSAPPPPSRRRQGRGAETPAAAARPLRRSRSNRRVPPAVVLQPERGALDAGVERARETTEATADPPVQASSPAPRGVQVPLFFGSREE